MNLLIEIKLYKIFECNEFFLFVFFLEKYQDLDILSNLSKLIVVVKIKLAHTNKTKIVHMQNQKKTRELHNCM